MQTGNETLSHDGANNEELCNHTGLQIRVVDLFAGAGGLSLGFDLFDGFADFHTVMALDNWNPAVRCYNANRPRTGGSRSTARVADLTWFAHPAEVLLFYLWHLALWQPDVLLKENLESIGIRRYFAELGAADALFERGLAALADEDSYRQALRAVDDRIFSIQICKAFLGKLGIASLKTGRIAGATLPWREEYREMFGEDVPSDTELNGLTPTVQEIAESLRAQWETDVNHLTEASGKTGRGQHSVVAARLGSLVSFLRSPSGDALRDMWVSWRARRDSIRAAFCLGKSVLLRELYTVNRRVHLILGGPPCKGFSRIGRAVIENLRDQGVHAWTSIEYGDERNALLHRYVLFLQALKPDAFLFENVAHFSSALRTPKGTLDATNLLEEAIADLSSDDVHYDVASAIVRARRHAVPQDRERFIMVGFNRATTGVGAAESFFELPTSDAEVPLLVALQGLDAPGEFAWEAGDGHGTGHRVRAYTLSDPALPDAYQQYVTWIRQPDPQTGIVPSHTDAHVVRRGRADDMALIRKFAPGQRWMDYKLRDSATISELRSVLEAVLKYREQNADSQLPTAVRLRDLLSRVNGGLLLRLILEEVSADLESGEAHHLLSSAYLDKGHDNHGDWFERLSAERPCKTIVAHIGKDTYGYIHPFANRALSIREAARVQSFPDFFDFGSAGVVDGYSIIGNAVPPLLANLFARRFDEIHAEFGVFGDGTTTQPRTVKTTPTQLVVTPKQLTMGMD